jgi:hypothetical protein
MYGEKLIPVFAFLILALGSLSSLYVYAFEDNTEVEGDEIIINGVSLKLSFLFENGETRVFKDLNVSGFALDDIIIISGVECPPCNSYKIIGSDGYSQTVTWDNMQNGLLTLEKNVVFLDLPKAFNIKDVERIEVV